MNPLLLGSKTPWGLVVAIGMISGERYYWLVSANGVAMMPAAVVEPEGSARRARNARCTTAPAVGQEAANKPTPKPEGTNG